MTAYQIFTLPRQTNIDSSVRVVPGAKASFFISGTSTPLDTYTDAALTIPSTNPVVADANGVFAQIFLDPSLVYKLTLTTAADVLIYTSDPCNDQILSQLIIGQILYPRTAAEISASVTPVQYFNPPGWLTRYTTSTGDDTTDNSTAFASAIAQAVIQGGAPVYIPMPTARWVINSRLIIAGAHPFKMTGAGWGYTPSGNPRGCLIRVGSGVTSGTAAFDFTTFTQGIEMSGFGMCVSSTGSNHKAFRFDEILQLRMSAMRFEGASSAADDCTAIEFLDPTVGPYSGAVDLDGLYITNMQRGIVIRNSNTTIKIRGCEIYGNNAASASLVGIQVDAGVAGVVIESSTFQGWVRGVLDNGTATRVTNCYFETNGTAAVDSSGTANAPYWTGNTVISGSGFLFPATSKSTISLREQNCRIDNAYLEMGLGYRENYRSIRMGAWQDYTPTYTGSGTLTYTTVTTTTARWRITADGLDIEWFNSGTIGGAGAEVRISLPTGATAVSRIRNVVFNFENATQKFGVAECQNGDAFIRIFKDSAVSGNWTAGAAETYGIISIKASGI